MRRRSSLAAAAVILASTLAGGCDTLKSLGLMSSDPSAEQAERLRLPPDLSAESINDGMSVPAARSASASMLGAPSQELKLRKAGGQRWLVVEAAPEKVWAWVQDYLQQNGVKIARESPRLGVIESDWIREPISIPRGVLSPEVKEAKDVQVADRYLFRVEAGAEPGTSEVFVAHRRVAAEEPGEEASWSLRPADPFLEAEMLRGFMVYLGQQKLESIQNVAAAEAERPQVQLERAEEGPVQLRIEGDFADAWRRVGLAIDRLGFTLEDRNRSEGKYFVRYDPRAETGGDGKGFFESLAFWRKSPGDEVPLYVIQLREAAGQALVTVTSESGEAASADVSERILALLQAQLR